MNKEPAFPGLHPSKECHYQDAGMSLRDYFAAKAVQGLMGRVWGDSPAEELFKTWAISAYGMADAMLEARNK